VISEDEERYSRHLTLPQIGAAGQAKIRQAHVLLVGMGGLGSPVAMYLAGAGVGKLTFADFDTVETSNLQRQIVHTTDRVGDLKTHSARTQCLALNPDVEIETIDHGLEEEDLAALVPQCTVVVECSDNFPTRFAVNAACVKHKVPLVSGAAIRFDGQIMVVRADKPNTACYRCLYKEGAETAETCAQTGILGPVVGMVGCVQAIETLKIITDIGHDLTGRLVLFDGLQMEWNEIQLQTSTDCPVCASQ